MGLWDWIGDEISNRPPLSSHTSWLAVMNRRDRRQGQKNTHPAPGGMIEATRCPDCDSEVRFTEQAPGIWSAEVRHDPTCSWWRYYQAATRGTDD